MINNNNRRRNFRPRPQKNNFRRRNGPTSLNNNGNSNFSRNGSMSNPFNLEKTIQKFHQLAKDAQSSGDPVVVENYLQHADHYSRRLAEINLKNTNNTQINKSEENSLDRDSNISKEKTNVDEGAAVANVETKD